MKKNMKNKIIVLTAMMLGIVSVSAFAAGNSSANLNANATLNSTCSISANNVSFGEFILTTTSENKFATGGLSILCSKNIVVTIDLIGGNQTVVANGNTRYMTGTAGNTDKLYYGVARPTGYSPPGGQWSNGFGGPLNHILVTTTGVEQPLSYQVRLNTLQNVKPDVYSDTLTFQITY